MMRLSLYAPRKTMLLLMMLVWSLMTSEFDKPHGSVGCWRGLWPYTAKAE